jgi:hypothetical protein
MIYRHAQSILVDAYLLPLATHHRFISFSLYCIGFILFILSLKKGMNRKGINRVQDTTSFNSLNLPGLTWLSYLLSANLTLSSTISLKAWSGLLFQWR